MWVDIRRPTVAGGKRRQVGDRFELPDKEALYLIHLGKAEQIEKDAPPRPDPPVVQKVNERVKKAKNVQRKSK